MPGVSFGSSFQNAQPIYRGLLGLGLNPNAAAGVAGNIYRESLGNPEAAGTGGRGLIGWTPPGTLAGSAFTGNVGRDIPAQIQAIGQYIAANGSVADVNAHARTPTEAATYFSNRYERPGIPALSERIGAANWIAQAASSGNWGSGVTQQGGGSTVTVNVGEPAPVPAELTGFFPGPLPELLAGPQGIFEGIAKLLAGKVNSPVEGLWHALGAIAADLDEITRNIEWLFQPSHWVRVGAFILGAAVVIPGVNNLSHAGSGDLSLATGILMVTIAGILFFIAFHNLPDDVKDLRGLLGWLSEGIRAKHAPASLSKSPPPSTPANPSAPSSKNAPTPTPQPGPSPTPPRTPPPGSHPAVTTPKPPQIPTPQPAPGG